MFEANVGYKVTIEMITVECCSCGTVFGMTSDLRDAFKKNSDKWFYCPNGHRQHYGTSEADRLAAELKKQKDATEFQIQQREKVEETLRKERIERRKVKTRLTNMKVRVGNGICPCCNRYFENLHKHMGNKHPDFKETE